ncbi:MAG TPA: transposase [Vicinamibacterales bacterium]|nr:transposase [Vicinamibacterales bacterium]
MPRKTRVIEPNTVYHVYNRRNDRQVLFPSARSRDAFVDLMDEGRTGYRIAICMYCVMETHWHQGIWVRDLREVTAVARYVQWLSSRHATRFRVVTGTRGNGHVYQDRYKSKPVETPEYYVTLNRYIEANPLDAGLVKRAEDWRWSSLAERTSGRPRIISDGPVPLPDNWVEIVNRKSDFDDYLMLA